MKLIYKILLALLAVAAAFLLWVFMSKAPSMDAYLKDGSAYDMAVKALGKNPSQEAVQLQARSLREQMTLGEKIHFLSGHTIGQSNRDIIKTRRSYNVTPLQAGGCKRLGIPPILFTDGPRGVVAGESTCFPVSVVRASSFDPDLEYRVGKAIADEAIAQGANYFAGVCINLLRNPLWGRAQESYGEDPFVLGEFGAALTRSVQEEGMIACPKHFALNSIEDIRFSVDARADERTLHEIYLPHFKKCVDAGALSIMGAYNKMNGAYCCENEPLLKGILRDEWGFKGFVMSDFVKGVHSAAGSLPAGLDMEMMFTMHYNRWSIKKALKKGTVALSDIDSAVENILYASLMQFPKIRPRGKEVIGSDEHRALALEAAEKGMVLLKNEGVLPLSIGTKVMVCGPYAEEVNVGDHGSSQVFDTKVITPMEGIGKVFPAASVENGDVAVICVGSNYKQEGEFFAGMNGNEKVKPADKGGDRASLRLTTEDISLIKRLKELGKKTVVVLYSGATIITGDWTRWADAIVMNYYSGCEGGTALANLLSGAVNFSGHLPFTIAKDENDYPPFKRIGETPYEIEYGYYHGYSLLDKEGKEAEYPFGYGLSYTSFKLDNVEVSRDDAHIIIKARVTNTGDRRGATVVQVYAGSDLSSTGEDRPLRQLKGFRRIDVAPSESVPVEICVPVESLRFRHNGGWVLDSRYNFYVGLDSRDALLRKIIATL